MRVLILKPQVYVPIFFPKICHSPVALSRAPIFKRKSLRRIPSRVFTHKGRARLLGPLLCFPSLHSLYPPNPSFTSMLCYPTINADIYPY
uniref:Uncharacterized protein n=1 Tax=Manihot esculenta TaxID=3983 RepID=A0A2C9WB34_MANES